MGVPNNDDSRGSIPDQLARVAARALSGRLVVVHEDGTSEIWIEHGRVTRARNPESDRRLAARFVVGGHALESDIAKATKSADGRPLIEAIAERGIVRRDVLESFETAEARYALAAAIGAGEDAARFEPDATDTPPPLIELDPLDLLADTETFLASLEAAERFAPPWAVPSLPNGYPGPDVNLSPEEWAVLTRVNGHASVGTIASETGLPEAEVALAVFRLSALGVAAVEDLDAALDAESSLAYLDEIEIPDVEIVADAPELIPVAHEPAADEPHYEAPRELEELAEALVEAAVAEPEADAPKAQDRGSETTALDVAAGGDNGDGNGHAAAVAAATAAFEPPPPPGHPEDAPVLPRAKGESRPDPEVDTKALLRELAWLARDQDRR